MTLKTTHISNFRGGAIPTSSQFKALIDDAIPGTRGPTETGFVFIQNGEATVDSSIPFIPNFVLSDFSFTSVKVTKEVSVA